MMVRNANDRAEKVSGLTEQYRAGEISEPVFVASLHALVDVDQIRFALDMNRAAHKASANYRRRMQNAV
jgi:hypothetical protein